MNPNLKRRALGSDDYRRVAVILVGLILSLLCACTHTAFAAQVYRIDPAPIMTTSGNVPFGGYPQLYAIPGATIQLCTDTACATPAQAYTDGTGNTQCSISAPVTLPGTTTCTSASGQQGQFGFWIQPGTYYFKITTPNGQSFGPYPISSPNAFTGGTLASLTVTGNFAQPANVLNVKADCGAVGDGAAVDTTAVTTCLNKAATQYSTGAGTVYFPPGTYLVNNLPCPSGLNIQGANILATILKSTLATPIFNCGATLSNIVISDMTLFGNSVGTMGFTASFASSEFLLQRVQIQSFTVQCIEDAGALLFTIRDALIHNCPIGMNIDAIHANQIVVETTRFQTNPTYGIKATAGNMIILDRDDFEGNGTSGNTATAGVYAVGLNGDGTYNCLVIHNSWFESNGGQAEIVIGQPSNGGHCNNIITDSIISGAQAPYGIYATGNKTMYTVQKVEAFSHTVSDIYDDGAVLRCSIEDSNYNGSANSCSRHPDGDAVRYPSFNGPDVFQSGGYSAVIAANSGGYTVIVAAGSGGIGTGHSLEILAAGNTSSQPAAFFGNNGGNGELLVNTTSSDFSSCIFCTLGTMASVSATTNAKVLSFNSSGGDGKSQIVVTKSGSGTTQPLEIFSDGTLLATFQPAAALKIAGTGQTIGTTAGTFAQLPGSPTAGDCKWITDSMSATFGATIAGAGANKVNACYDGTNWTVH